MALLTSLPTELVLCIAEHLPFNSVKSMSLTTRQIHQMLVPSLFKCIRVTNREEENDDSWEVLHKYEDRVDKLAFEIYFVSKFSKYRDVLNTCLGLPGLVRQMLRGKVFSRISQVRVSCFVGNFEHMVFGAEGVHITDTPETEDDVAVKEEEWMWRGLLNETFRALAARKGLKKLEVRSMLPKACSTFYTSEWRTLIEGLDDLDIDLWGGHGGYHASDFGYKGGLGVLRSTTTDGYIDFVERTNDFFFAHCKSATRLRLAADVNTPIGTAGEKPHVAIPLKPENLPVLTHFELENCILDPALGRFINAHSQKLKSLSLRNCHTLDGPIDEYELFEWDCMLRRFHDCRPVLEDLTIINDSFTLTGEEELHPKELGLFVPENEDTGVRELRKRLKDDPSCRLWSFVNIDPELGEMWQDHWSTIYYASDGSTPWMSYYYEALVARVERNRTLLD
ncbi:hypothetical protein TI39_contig290g00008 [Zymoseptoria brevis]|uniref:F-box domain-containing protein n=1 Tax=Zymoseptoria brevis TaxID=1047168 RepID=A0A0F4GVM4_9PEZI|nr:hypothetical protein TI39_contig290g00008 [Zymoseptoria brevis]